MRIGAYYRQDWAPAGIDPDILEIQLGQWLENQAKVSIDVLINQTNEMTGEQMEILLVYLEFQRIRVPRQAEITRQLMRSTILKLAPPEAAAAIRRGEFILDIKDSTRFDHMRILVGQIRPWLSRMEWEIFEAASDAAFVTTDSPVSLYNPSILPPNEAGLAQAGTMVFFPLSSRFALLMRHPECRNDPLTVLPDPSSQDQPLSIRRGVIWPRRVVNSSNWKMVRLSDRLIVAESREILEACEVEK